MDVNFNSLLGSPFPLLVPSSSLKKALSFLEVLRFKKVAFDYELGMKMANKEVLVQCSGILMGSKFLIFVSQTKYALHHIFDEMMRLSNDQMNFSRTVQKENSDLQRTSEEQTNSPFIELTRMNSELLTLQREVAKKNAELERLNIAIQELSVLDDLTKVYNRRGFFQIGELSAALALRSQNPLSVIMFDIDHFKSVNDQFGHLTGDHVLVEVVQRCLTEVRKTDTFGRLGGEEFCILLPSTSVEMCTEVAERIRGAVCADTLQTSQGPLGVTISLGVASLGPGIEGLESLLEIADRAMYCAKSSGRNQVCIADQPN